MKIFFPKIFPVLFLLIILFSCEKRQQTSAPLSAKTEVDSLNHYAETIPDKSPEEKIKLWKQKLESAKAEPAKAVANFNIAKSFAPLNIDSSEVYINAALELIDRNPEFLVEKMRIYNGAGNVANAKNRLYQSAYFYNTSAAIIVADRDLDADTKSKIICLLSAAQHNALLKQYATAKKQNDFALKLIKNDTAYSDYAHRAFDQNFGCVLNTDKNLDSLKSLVQKMQKVLPYCKNPESARFSYQDKGTYFDITKQTDSARIYLQKTQDYDLADYQENQKGNAAENLVTSYCNLAQHFVNTKNWVSAKENLGKAEDIFSKNRAEMNDENEMFLRKNKAKFFAATGDYQNAYLETDKERALQDKILASANIQSMEEMALIYQLQAKDKSISRLNRNISSNRWIMLSTALGFLLALTFLGLLFYRNRQRKILELKQQQLLQQKLLRTQMEPHFIFNTLSSLQSFIRFGETDKALKYLQHFSALLRSNLELSRENFVPLSDELKGLENYLELQKMRYEDRFRYEINMADNLDPASVNIPTMLIQPFVENSIIHGLKGIRHQMCITISIKKSDNQLQVEIRDDGNGGETGSGEPAGKSLSGSIAKERLQILDRSRTAAAKISVNHTPGTGTTVLMDLPVEG